MTRTPRLSTQHFEATSMLFFALMAGCILSAGAQTPDAPIPPTKPKWSAEQIEQT
ncbi:MAG: hypothetical protein H7332_12750, partial [Bdellovibrionales bacterium]|nr:hypothetical protein [Ramlibacter sp.]